MPNWNYSWNGSYFITICTHSKSPLFGSIKDENMIRSRIGDIANNYWLQIPDHFADVGLGEYIIMPDHIHGIIIINKPDGNNGNIDDDFPDVDKNHTDIIENRTDIIENNTDIIENNTDIIVETRQCLVSTGPSTPIPTPSKFVPPTIPNGIRHVGGSAMKKRFQNPGKNTVSSIIGSYKSIVTKNARKINPNFKWQARFWDRLIQTEDHYRIVERYIRNNPKNWRKPKGVYEKRG
jgi:REP element-mobilizing transposase RayT